MVPCLLVCANKHITCYKIKNKAAVLKRAKMGKIVCPRCGKPIEEFEQPSWSPAKQYLCDKGHVTTIYPFTTDHYNISWSDKEFVNIGSDLEHVIKDIESGEICCPIPVGNDICNRKLVPLDNSELQPAKLSVAKTKTRVGDIWDKAHCPDPKSGTYDKDFQFRETEFSRRNKQRVKHMRRERLTKPAGTPISRPTDKSYRVNNYRRPPKGEI